MKHIYIFNIPTTQRCQFVKLMIFSDPFNLRDLFALIWFLSNTILWFTTCMHFNETLVPLNWFRVCPSCWTRVHSWVLGCIVICNIIIRKYTTSTCLLFCTSHSTCKIWHNTMTINNLKDINSERFWMKFVFDILHRCLLSKFRRFWNWTLYCCKSQT